MKRLSLTAGVLLAFTVPLVLTSQFLVLPQVQATSEALAQVDALQNSNGQLSPSKQKTAYQQQLEATKKQALTLLPSEDEPYALSVQVEALAKGIGVTLTALTVSSGAGNTLPKTTPADGAAAAPAASTAQKVTISTSVSGSYKLIQDFIAGLTALDRYIQIDQATLALVATDQLTATIVAYAYYLPAAK